MSDVGSVNSNLMQYYLMNAAGGTGLYGTDSTTSTSSIDASSMLSSSGGMDFSSILQAQLLQSMANGENTSTSETSSSEDSSKQAQLLMAMMMGSGSSMREESSQLMTLALMQAYTKNGQGLLSGLLGNTSSTSDLVNNIVNGLAENTSTEKVADGTKVETVNSEAFTTTGNAEIDAAIKKASETYNLDPNFIKSVIKAESGFNPNAVSSANAQGLMQITPVASVYKEMSDPFNIEENVMAGTKKLSILINMYGSKEMALAAYNAGGGTLKNRGVNSSADFDKLPKETQNYIPKIMKFYEEYNSELKSI